MKRLVFKFVLLIVPVAAVFLLVNFLYRRTNFWKSKDYAYKYTDAPYELEFGCFGSSIPCYAQKYDVVPELKAWNFANVTEIYYWTRKVVKNYINHFAKGAVVVLEISFFQIEDRATSYRERYYRTLPKEDVDNWSFAEWLAYDKFPFVTAGKDKYRIFKDISVEEMSSYYDRMDGATSQRIQEFAKNAYIGLESRNSDKKEGFKENFEELSDMIDMCYDYGVVPVLVSMPVADAMASCFEDDPGFFGRYDQFTKELQEKYPNIVFLDYSRDENFVSNYGYFKDAVHMNNIGAEKFTLTLVKDLRSRGLLR